MEIDYEYLSDEEENQGGILNKILNRKKNYPFNRQK